MLGLLTSQRIVLIHERSCGIDQHARTDFQRFPGNYVTRLGNPHIVLAPRAQRFDVICRNAAAIHRRTDKLEDKTCVVIAQVGIGILKAAKIIVGADYWLFLFGQPPAQQARRTGKTIAEQPIDPGAHPNKPGGKTETFFDRCKEADFLNPRRVVFQQVITAFA